jgi:hypothetical protein
MTWVQPFDILLKYKEMAGEVEGQKEMGLAMNNITNPMLSPIWVEIKTYFKTKLTGASK